MRDYPRRLQVKETSIVHATAWTRIDMHRSWDVAACGLEFILVACREVSPDTGATCLACIARGAV